MCPEWSWFVDPCHVGRQKPDKVNQTFGWLTRCQGLSPWFHDTESSVVSIVYVDIKIRYQHDLLLKLLKWTKIKSMPTHA